MINSLYYVDDTYEEIDCLNKMGYHFSKNFEHLVFANFDINTDNSEVPDLRSYVLDPFRIGIPSKYYDKFDPFPYGSILGITELQKYFPASMNDYIRTEVLQYFQTTRHNNVSVITDCQRPQDVAKKIRDLFNLFIECCGVEEIISDGIVVGHKWHFKIIDDPLVLDKYLSSKDESLCFKCTFVSNRYLYEAYDSYFCKILHYKNFINSDYVIKHFNEFEDVNVECPEGYFVSRTNRANETAKFDDEVIY